MEQRLVDFETAKLVKEKGFNWATHNYFKKDLRLEVYKEGVGYDSDYWGDYYNYDWNTNGEPYKPFTQDCISRPTQSLLHQWLRKEHNIDVEVKVYTRPHYCVTIISKYASTFDLKNPNPINEDHQYAFETYENAMDEGLIQAIQLVK